MEIIINETDKTPFIKFDFDNKVLEIKGRSFPEDSRKFYQEIFDEINNYKSDTLKIILSFEYINTSSAKMVLDILKHARHINNISVTWINEEDDSEMTEMGEYFSLLSEIKFKYETVKEF